MFEYSDQFGLAGSIVSAILQAVALFTLADMLATIAPVFEKLGVLLFVVAAIGGITRVANGGDMRDALLLVLGPILFLAAMKSTVNVRVVTDSASNDRQKLTDGVVAMVGQARGAAAVDVPIVLWVFDRFSRTVIGTLVELLQTDAFQQATIRAARDRLMSRILAADKADPHFLMLLTLSLSGECAEITSLDWDLSQPRFKTAPAGTLDAALAQTKRTRRQYLSEKHQRLDNELVEYLTGLGVAAVGDPTCNEVWLYTQKLAFDYADQMLSNQSTLRSEFPELTNLQWMQALDFVKAKLAPENAPASDLTQAYKVLAAFLIRNSSSRSAHGAMSARLSGRPDWMLTQDPKEDATSEELGKSLDSARSIVVRFAASIPYVQGLCLYLLTVSFPFFCLLLVLPQRISSILTWMSLWMWVKSWDVGFAIVGLIREIVWQFLPHTSEILGINSLAAVNWADPASMFALLNADSPELQFQTYYGVLAMLTLSVPVVMGYCFHAATGMADVISRGFARGGRS